MASRESYSWTNDPHKMNNASNVSTSEGSDVVARLLNVIIGEVLGQVEARIDEIGKRLGDLEYKINRGAEDSEQSSGLADRVRELEERIEDTATRDDVRDVERQVEDIDVESAVTDAINDLDLTREVRDVLLGMNDEQAKEFVSKGLSSILTEANRI